MSMRLVSQAKMQNKVHSTGIQCSVLTQHGRRCRLKDSHSNSQDKSNEECWMEQFDQQLETVRHPNLLH